MKEVLCVIPARGNSKGIKRKNLKNLCGKPLIYYAINTALKSKNISRVIVSSEDDEIASISKQYGADVPFLRPNNLSEDNVHSVFPVIDCLEKLKKEESYNPDAVVMFLPTAPLTTSKDLDNAINLFFSMVTNVISVCDFDKPIASIREIIDGHLVPIIKKKNYNIQRQDFKYYIVNAAIYVSSPKTLIKNKTFHTKNVLPLNMKKENSLDINDLIDFEICEYILKQKTKR